MTGIGKSMCMLVLMLPLALTVGCGDKKADHSGAGVAGCGCGCGDADAAKIAESMGKLMPSDRALAEAQKTCPVTGEALGSMGTPIKVMVKDRAVFLCCASCKKKIEADPDKYLAILDAR